MFVLAVDKFVPGFLGVLTQDVIVVRVKSNVIFLNVGVKLISSENLSNFDKLIVVVFSLEEWFLLENHAREHATKRPDIKRIVISLQVNKKLWALEIS